MSYHFLGIPEVKYRIASRDMIKPSPPTPPIAKPIRVTGERYNRSGPDSFA